MCRRTCSQQRNAIASLAQPCNGGKVSSFAVVAANARLPFTAFLDLSLHPQAPRRLTIAEATRALEDAGGDVSTAIAELLAAEEAADQ